MADPVSSYDAKLLKNLGGVGLVMTIIFTISVKTHNDRNLYLFLIFHRITIFLTLNKNFVEKKII